MDRLGITKTVNYKEAPIEYIWEEGFFCGFTTYGDWIKRTDPRMLEDLKYSGVNLNHRHRKIKYPIFGLDKRVVNDEEFEGTFFAFGHTHAVPMDVFVECMTNARLGAAAFYIYAYLYSRCGMNNGTIEVSLERMKSMTGLRHTTINTALSNLKAFNLIKCYPATFVVNKGDYETGASTYEVVDKESLFHLEPQDFKKRDVRYIETILK